MRLKVPRAICTGKPEPHPWTRDNRSGIIYRIELSDGSGNVRINCKDEAVYAAFAPFQAFEVDLDLTTMGNGNLRVEAIHAQPTK